MWTFEQLEALKEAGLPQYGDGWYITGHMGKDYCMSKTNYHRGMYEPTDKELNDWLCFK